MANITEKNGKFHVRVYRKGASAVCKSFLVRKDAIAWAKQTEADIQMGRWKDPKAIDSITLKAALLRYSQDVTPGKKSAAGEVYIIGVIARSKLAAMQLVDIRSLDVAALRDQWKAKGLAAATVVRRLAIVSHVFEVARKEWGYEVANPVKLISKPKIDNARDRRLLPGEFDAILFACDSLETSNAARLAVETAMRLSEIAKLRWADINFAARTASLRDTKNGRPRVVPLSPAAIATLSAIPRRIDGKLFGIVAQSISRSWARAVARARSRYLAECAIKCIRPDPAYLVDLHFHDLRHEATSRLFELGVFNVMEVASITGHQTMQMLARYTHVQASKLAAKFEVM